MTTGLIKSGQQNHWGKETKELIRQMRKVNPNVEINIFASLHKVHLDTLPGYKTGGEMHSFLEKLK